MANWASRMHKQASHFRSAVLCSRPISSASSYPYRIDKVKFGVPLQEVFKNGIPGPLLILLLKLNKESPSKRLVFRASGNPTAIKDLIHCLKHGRLVNVEHYSVHTIACVVSRFIREIPDGVFGVDGDRKLKTLMKLKYEDKKSKHFRKFVTSLPSYTQQFLVLIFGTFRAVASNAAKIDTGMTSEALSISVGTSFFRSYIGDGQKARLEDLPRLKSTIDKMNRCIQYIIDNFAQSDLFGSENYQYYTQITGRVLKVQDKWYYCFELPPATNDELPVQDGVEVEQTWLQWQTDRRRLLNQKYSHSMPALNTPSPDEHNELPLDSMFEHAHIESCRRLTVSVEFLDSSLCNPARKSRSWGQGINRSLVMGGDLAIDHSDSNCVGNSSPDEINSTKFGCLNEPPKPKMDSFKMTTGEAALTDGDPNPKRRYIQDCKKSRPKSLVSRQRRMCALGTINLKDLSPKLTKNTEDTGDFNVNQKISKESTETEETAAYSSDATDSYKTVTSTTNGGDAKEDTFMQDLFPKLKIRGCSLKELAESEARTKL